MREVSHGVFPFGEPVREVKQADDGRPRRLFVLGVYASAVHACWMMNGKVMVRALAVASEPCIFWNGEGADRIISHIQARMPEGLGTLTSAGEQFNGPSGKALDEHILRPLLGAPREDVWLCDLRPWSCSNEGQVDAICRYHKRIVGTTLPRATVETARDAQAKWADEARQGAIMAEFRRSGARVLVTLGDQPLEHFVHPRGGKWSKLSELRYGRLVPITLDGMSLHLLPLAHPRQIGRLGAHSPKWHKEHQQWKDTVAAEVSAAVKTM